MGYPQQPIMMPGQAMINPATQQQQMQMMQQQQMMNMQIQNQMLVAEEMALM